MLAAPPMETTVGRSRSAGGHAASQTFAIFPTATRPRLLVPLASKRAAAAALRGPSHAREHHVRLARVLFRIGARIGVAQYLVRDRLFIWLGAEKGTTAVLSNILITEHLKEIFGRRDIEVAVRVGRVRPNRKPLIEVLTPDGTVLGYVKLGWNPLTRRLIRNEARVLADLGHRRDSLAGFEVPRILHNGKWRDLEILALSPLDGRLFRPRRSNIAAAVAAMNQISQLSAGYEMRLAESDYWRTARKRVGAVTNGDSDIAELADLVERSFGAEVLPFGSWHGDWTPWNMAWRRGTLAIWDWERSDHGVPVGLDAAHFDFQTALWAAHHRWPSALRRTLAGRTPLLSTLQLPPTRSRLLLALHLLEMSVRLREGLRADVSPPDSTYLPALAAVLTRHR